MIKKVLFLCMFLSLSFVMYGMRKSEQAKILSSNEVVFNLVLNYLPEDHATIRSAARTNQYGKECMLRAAFDRKKKLRPSWNNYLGYFTHIYGSANYWVCRRMSKANVLVLGYCQLKDGEIEEKNKEATGFISPLYHNPKPFIDRDGIVHFCAYGLYDYRKYMHKQDEYRNVKEAGILIYSSDGPKRVCYGRYGPTGGSFDLSYLLFYPFLLEAILAVCSTNEELKLHRNDPVLLAMHSFESIAIPDNYKKRVEFSLERDFQQRSLLEDWRAKTLFENFPQYIKDAIEERYKECVKNQ